MSTLQSHESRKKGTVIAMVAVLTPVLVGSAALAIDVGLIVNAKADLQRAADAGAIAGAIALSHAGLSENSFDVARAAAKDYVERNPVMGKTVTLDTQIDVEFGRATYNSQAAKYGFAPTTDTPEAVRVRVRMSESSPNGPLSLIMARVMGFNETGVEAVATATILPRDIAIVADVSGSQAYDSQLRRYKTRDINNFEIWDLLPGGSDDVPSLWDVSELPAEDGQSEGPAWGFMKTLAYGDDVNADDYNPTRDSGLIRLREDRDWSSPSMRDFLTAEGYSAEEIGMIMNTSGESQDQWALRVATALGLAQWVSGRTGGLGDVENLPTIGDGDNRIESSELLWTEKFLDGSVSESRDFWLNYIKETQDAPGGSEFDSRFGVKTVVDYLAEDPWGIDIPQVRDAALQPLKAQKDAIVSLVEFLNDLDTFDMMALTVYRGSGGLAVELGDNLSNVSAALSKMMPAHPSYGRGTNIGDGIAAGTAELKSSRVRSHTKKLMILLTDGLANRAPSGWNAREWALHNARLAAEEGFQIAAISVGQGADKDLMAQIADIGSGIHFHAQGSIEEYTAQLEQAFLQIGLRRQVQLIE